jgi:hypothetical protein
MHEYFDDIREPHLNGLTIRKPRILSPDAASISSSHKPPFQTKNHVSNKNSLSIANNN